MENLSVKGLTISMGTLWSTCTFLMGIGAMFGYGTVFVKAMSTVYVGYNATPTGVLVGALYGFLDGAGAGFMISYIYNIVVKNLK